MDSFEGGRLDIMRIQETHIIGCGVIDYMMGSENIVWEGMEEGGVWCGVEWIREVREGGRGRKDV